MKRSSMSHARKSNRSSEYLPLSENDDYDSANGTHWVSDVRHKYHSPEEIAELRSMRSTDDRQGVLDVPWAGEYTDNDGIGEGGDMQGSERPPELARLERSREFAPIGPHTSFLWFVETDWFQALAAVVIITNIVTMVLEADDPRKKDTFFILDQAMLCFYVFELVSRAAFFKTSFIHGPMRFVAWNYLDIVVVASGIFSEWLLPVVGFKETQSDSRPHPMHSVLTLVRMLRIFRVVKIARIFLHVDLSWTEKPFFQSFIGAVILFNSLLMGAETDIDWQGWAYMEQILLTIYVFELSVRMKSAGFYFFKWSNIDIVWNILDFVIVVSSTLDTWIMPLIVMLHRIFFPAKAVEHGEEKSGHMSMAQVMMLMRMLRLMRILRIVRLIKSVKPLYILVTGMLAALQGVMWVLVLTLTVLYAAAILSTRLIGHGLLFPTGTVPDASLQPFQSVPDSMFTLFRVMSGTTSESTDDSLEMLMLAEPVFKFVFVFFLVTSSWTLLSILTAVVSENMISTTSSEEQLMRIASDDEDRAGHIQALRDIFCIIDASGNGSVSPQEFDEFLEDKQNALNTARRCRVPVREVKEVLQTLHTYGKEVSMQDFVTHLADVGAPVTERSVMRIEARLTMFRREIAVEFEQLAALVRSLHASDGLGPEPTPGSMAATKPATDKAGVEGSGKKPENVSGIAQDVAQDIAQDIARDIARARLDVANPASSGPLPSPTGSKASAVEELAHGGVALAPQLASLRAQAVKAAESTQQALRALQDESARARLETHRVVEQLRTDMRASFVEVLADVAALDGQSGRPLQQRGARARGANNNPAEGSSGVAPTPAMSGTRNEPVNGCGFEKRPA